MCFPVTISELMRKSLQYDYSVQTAYSTWLDIADCFLEESIASLSVHNYEKAYVDLTRFIDLILNKLPNHPEFYPNEHFEHLKLYEIPEAQSTSAQILNTLIKKAQNKSVEVFSTTLDVDNDVELMKLIEDNSYGCETDTIRTNNILCDKDGAFNNGYDYEWNNSRYQTNSSPSHQASSPIPIPNSPVDKNANLFVDTDSHQPEPQRPLTAPNMGQPQENMSVLTGETGVHLLLPMNVQSTLECQPKHIRAYSHGSLYKGKSNIFDQTFTSPLTPERTTFALANNVEHSLYDFNNAVHGNANFDMSGLESPLSTSGSPKTKTTASRKRHSKRYSYHFDREEFLKNSGSNSNANSLTLGSSVNYLQPNKTRRHSISYDKTPRNVPFNPRNSFTTDNYSINEIFGDKQSKPSLRGHTTKQINDQQDHADKKWFFFYMC